VFGLFTNWFRAPALLLGWLVGIVGGTWVVFADGLKPVHTVMINGADYTIYIGLLALAVNVIVAIVANAIPRAVAPARLKQI
jgi:SSS family solute:Na+ symporter